MVPQWLLGEVDQYFADIPTSFKPQTILDIGANVGAFALRARQFWPDAAIICCEPMPYNVVELRKNATDSQIISAAIRGFSGVDEIFIGDNFVTGGFVQFGRQTDKRLLVECLAADRLPACELVKLDTEGCEVEILKTLRLDRAQAVFLEHHSLSDALEIKSMLGDRFAVREHDPRAAIGTLVFYRR